MQNKFLVVVIGILFILVSCGKLDNESVIKEVKQDIESNNDYYKSIKDVTKSGVVDCDVNEDKIIVNEGKSDSKIDTDLKADKIEIVLFHSTNRCYSCIKMEELIRKTLDTKFKEEIKSGKIVFLTVNGELEENTEMVRKYKSTGLSVYFNQIIDGKDNINVENTAWRLISDDDKFVEYFKEKLDSL